MKHPAVLLLVGDDADDAVLPVPSSTATVYHHCTEWLGYPSVAVRFSEPAVLLATSN